MNNMNFKIPFYGKKGTIKDIKEEDKRYIVIRYGISESEEEFFYIAKNKKNLNGILNNYYDNLLEYLTINNSKYKTYKNTRLKKKINLKFITSILIGSSLLILSSIPLINTHEAIGFIGVAFNTIAIPATIYSVKEIIKDKKDKKKAQFIKNYDKLTHKYQSDIKRYTKSKIETKYNGLIKDDNKPVIDLTKIRILKQDTKKNAA